MKELHEITPTVIPLTRSQQTGYAKFCERLEQLQIESAKETADMQSFLRLCLEENGGDTTQTYTFHEPSREWRLKQDA